MGALELFLHDERTPYPALVKAALAHVQFETIHPFLDGNGRLGRLLISFLLHHDGVLSRPLLYLSLYFKQHRAEYYRLLDAVRTEGNWEAWLDFFLEGIKTTADNAVQTARRLVAVFQEDCGSRADGSAVCGERTAGAGGLAQPACAVSQGSLPPSELDLPDCGQGYGDAGRARHRTRGDRPTEEPAVCV